MLRMMRRLLPVLLSSFMLVSMLGCSPQPGAEAKPSPATQELESQSTEPVKAPESSDIMVNSGLFINDVPVQADVAPIIDKGEFFISEKTMNALLATEVNAHEGFIKIPYRNGKQVELWTDKPDGKFDGTMFPLAASAFEKDGKIYLPLASILKALNIPFKWDGQGDFRVAEDKNRVLYSFKEGSSSFYYNTPLYRNGAVFIGTSIKLHADPVNDNFFFKLDEKLNKVWAYPLGSDEVRGAADMDPQGNLYFTVQTGHVKGSHQGSRLFVYSLDPAGNLRWKTQVSAVKTVPDVGTMEVTVGAYLYVLGDHLQALDLATGKVVWKYADQNVKNGSKPLLDSAGNLYLQGLGTACSFTSEGKLRWSYKPSGDAFMVNNGCMTSLSFTPGQANVILLVDVWVYNLNAETGKLNWKFNSKIMGETREKVAIDEKGTIYVCTKNGNKPCTFYAIKADGSGVAWKHEGFGEAAGSPALGDSRLAYFGTEELLINANNLRVPGIHAINIDTGELAWEIKMDTDFASSPVFGPPGILYIAGMDGKINAIDCDSKGPLPGAGNAQFN